VDRRGLVRGRVVASSGRVLLAHAVQPRGFAQRLRGLIGRAALDAQEGWWFTACPAVHTIGMRYPIDVVHLCARGTILRLVHGLAPFRLSACAHGAQVLELRAGAIERLGLCAGQRLAFVP
jgi:uncharacterized protein